MQATSVSIYHGAGMMDIYRLFYPLYSSIGLRIKIGRCRLPKLVGNYMGHSGMPVIRSGLRQKKLLTKQVSTVDFTACTKEVREIKFRGMRYGSWKRMDFPSASGLLLRKSALDWNGAGELFIN